MITASIRRRAARTALERASASASASASTRGANGSGVRAIGAPRTFTTRATRRARGFGAMKASTSSSVSSPWALRAAAPMATKAPAPTPNRAMRDDFLNASSAAYLDALEDQYRADPKSVPESWAALLRQLGTCVI